jgi:hypothetical protein
MVINDRLSCSVYYEDTLKNLLTSTHDQVSKKFPLQASVTTGTAQRVDPSLKIEASIECVLNKITNFV